MSDNAGESNRSNGRWKAIIVRRLPVSPLHPDFWTMYAASFLVDLGLCIYFFMFNLFLVEHRFTEHAIGFITASLTIGTLVGTVPVSILAERIGLRPMLLLYVLLAPLCLASRSLFLGMPSQLTLAFLAGVMMSTWMVCFSPTLAKLTTPENRTFGFSLFIATGIGSGSLAGLIGGYLPGLIQHLGARAAKIDGLRIVLLAACIIVSCAAIPILRLHFEAVNITKTGTRIFSGFLIRFLIAISLWNFSISFFTPFASVYLSRKIGLSVSHIGAIFAASQLIQVGAVLLAPAIYKRVGVVAGIAIAQLATACSLLALSHASRSSSAVGIYLLLTAVQWMSGPGISSLLMDWTPEENRSYASATYNFVNLASQASAAALAGKAFERCGYATPLSVNAGIAALAAVVLYSLLRQSNNIAVPMPLSQGNNSVDAC